MEICGDDLPPLPPPLDSPPASGLIEVVSLAGRRSLPAVETLSDDDVALARCVADASILQPASQFQSGGMQSKWSLQRSAAVAQAMAKHRKKLDPLSSSVQGQNKAHASNFHVPSRGPRSIDELFPWNVDACKTRGFRTRSERWTPNSVQRSLEFGPLRRTAADACGLSDRPLQGSTTNRARVPLSRGSPSLSRSSSRSSISSCSESSVDAMEVAVPRLDHPAIRRKQISVALDRAQQTVPKVRVAAPSLPKSVLCQGASHDPSAMLPGSLVTQNDLAFAGCDSQIPSGLLPSIGDTGSAMGQVSQNRMFPRSNIDDRAVALDEPGESEDDLTMTPDEHGWRTSARKAPLHHRDIPRPPFVIDAFLDACDFVASCSRFAMEQLARSRAHGRAHAHAKARARSRKRDREA